MIVNEGAGEALDFDGRRFHTLCVGEKGVFRFNLVDRGVAGHASMPDDGRQRAVEMVRCCRGSTAASPSSTTTGASRRHARGVARRAGRRICGRASSACGQSSRGWPTGRADARASRSRRRWPRHRERSTWFLRDARCAWIAACRRASVRTMSAARLTELIGPRGGAATIASSFETTRSETALALEGPLADALAGFVEEWDPDARLLPYVMPGFTDSHWFRKAFPNASPTASSHNAR